jgi:uncharacterized protein
MRRMFGRSAAARRAAGIAMSRLADVVDRAGALLGRLERLLPGAPSAVDWDAAVAFRWRRTRQEALLQPVRQPDRIRLSDLLEVDGQKAELLRNTLQLVSGYSANNVLLWGARGTGKSALVKAVLNELAPRGLRLVEVAKHDLVDLPDIVERLCGRPERFVVFCDDLSFDAEEPGYKALKVVLDGSVSAASDNVLVYATSNRRHLMPELMQENREARTVEAEIHPGETTEEKIALSERFGLCLSFYPFRQEQYLAIVEHWLGRLGMGLAERGDYVEPALQWALARGSRSGRVAWQFARDWAGRARLRELENTAGHPFRESGV